MPYLLLADLVLALHVGFVAFVVFGGLFVLRWPRVAWLHVPVAIWGVFVEYAGLVCPLTPLESALRQRGGEAGYAGDFIAHYLTAVLYPVGLTRGLQILLGTLALAINVAVYWRVAARRRGRHRPTKGRYTRALRAPGEGIVMEKRFGVLGSGQVGQVLAKGLKTHGYEVMIGSRTPAKLAAFGSAAGIATGTFAEVARWAEGIVLAVVGRAAQQALEEAGRASLKGKLVIDTTNPISDKPPVDGVIAFFTGPNASLMESLQAAFPEVRFVKAFNSVGNALMVNPTFSRGRPTMFYCGNDADAKAVVARIVDQFGWEGADMGSVVAARAIEPLCQLWCIPGLRENRWTHAFALLRP